MEIEMRTRRSDPLYTERKNEKPSMVRQSDGVITDINAIVARYQSTGILTHLNHQVPQYGDTSAAVDLHTAMNTVNDAEEMFAELPSAVRKAAENDPVTFLNMLATEEGTEALVDAGLPGFERRSDDQVDPVTPAPRAEPETPAEPAAE